MKRFSNILFVAETSADDSAAFGRAVALANNNQAALTLVDVVEAIPADVRMAITAVTPDELCNIAATEKSEKLQEIIKTNGEADLSVETKVLIGNRFIEIVRDVLIHERDLVIKSVENTQGIGQNLSGGTDKKLLRKCPCPVWLIKSSQQQGYREILVALAYEPDNPENEPLNRQLLEIASSLALSEFAALHVVHAWRFEHESQYRSPRLGLSTVEVDKMVEEEERTRRDWLTKLVQRFCAIQGEETSDYVKPQLHLVKGDARIVVPECANALGAELVVMGTVGRTGIPGFFIGNTAEDVLNQIDCSVLAIKPAGFISPVTTDIGG